MADRRRELALALHLFRYGVPLAGPTGDGAPIGSGCGPSHSGRTSPRRTGPPEHLVQRALRLQDAMAR